MKFFLAPFVLVLTSLFFNSSIFGNHINVRILGYPRSGNHWIRFCTEKLLTDACNHAWIQSYDPSSQPPYREAETFYLDFGHSPTKLKLNNLDQSQNYLIMILRNYRECMMRRYNNQPETVFKHLKLECFNFYHIKKVFDHSGINYPIDLKCYDQWNPKTRFLIYYEELMKDPEKVLKDLMKFLGKDETLVDTFMEDFEKLQNQSYDRYVNPESRFTGLDHHTALMPKELILDCDQFMKENYTKLWEKYLSRYDWQKNQTKNQSTN